MTDIKYTYCHTCEVSCGLKVTVNNNRITRLEPDREHVASRGYACPKGLRFDAIQYSPDRVLQPRKRQGNNWENISWDRSLSEIGAKVRLLIDRHGPDSIAFYGGSGPGYNYSGSMMWNALIDGVGTKNIFAAGSQDCINKLLVYQHMYGSGFRIGYPDMENTQMLIFVGANPAVSKMTLTQVPRPAQQLRRIVGRGGRVVFIDPRRTESVKAAGELYYIRPDTDVYFLMAFLNELICAGGVDQRCVSQYMRGFEALAEACAPWTPERAERVTSIPADSLRQLVAAYCEARGAAFYCSTGVNMGTNGTLAFWTAEAINAVSGNLDRPGGILFGQGLFDMAKVLKKAGRLERPDRTRVSGRPSVLDTFPAAVMAEEILTPGQGQIKALFIYGGNPLLTCPNPNGRLEEAFKSLELLVSIDLFQNESGDLAHYILPSTTYMERSDLPMVIHWMAGDQPKRY
ncbi:MAG: molybdopterin-dependent oxidoreductase, partial [bacterium]|nr:molybdopterin-dependent oxidoreductase [bacterium]